MNPQRYSSQPAKRNPEDHWHSMATEWPRPEAHAMDAQTKAEQAARSVMHPESSEPDWRYYYGALGG